MHGSMHMDAYGLRFYLENGMSCDKLRMYMVIPRVTIKKNKEV